MKKILLTVVMMTMLSFTALDAHASNATVSSAISTEITEEIPENATNYIKANFKDIISSGKYFCEDLGVKSDELDDTYIGNPFYVYDSSTDNEIFYYPIISNVDNKIILVVTVMDTNNGWTIEYNTNLVDPLNDINYASGEYIFYNENGSIIADNSESRVVLETNETTENDSDFTKKDFYEKVTAISSKIKTLKEIDTEDNTKINSFGIDLGYTPGLVIIDTSTTKGARCSLYNEASTGSYNICWAASVATIVNYIKGTSYTAKNICTHMDLPYSEQNGYVSLDALNDYVSGYEAQIASKSIIKNDIDNKKPLFMICVPEDGGSGHSTVLYGYYTSVSSGNLYVRIWDTSGSGGISVVKYNGSSTCFLGVSGKVYYWYNIACLSYY